MPTMAFKYRAYCNRETEANAIRWLHMCAELWNALVEQREDCYYRMGWGRIKWQMRPLLSADKPRQPKPRKPGNDRPARLCPDGYTFGGLTAYEQQGELTRLKREFPEYREVGSQVLKDIVRRVDKAQKAFFSNVKARRTGNGNGRIAGPPKRKRYRDWEFGSFTFPNSSGWKLIDRIRDDGRVSDDKGLSINNVGTFRLRTHKTRPISGDIRTVTVSRERSGKWFVSFACEVPADTPYPKTDREIGIDVGVTIFATLSDGVRIENPRFLQHATAREAALQRELSHRTNRGKNGKPLRAGLQSKRYRRTLLALRRFYEHLSNQRENFTCQTAHDLVSRYDVLKIEDLNIVGMMEKDPRSLARKIGDAAWYMFGTRLTQAAQRVGKTVIRVPPEYTTMTCNNCGAVKEMPLHIRIYDCPVCKKVQDRTLNSALNIAEG